MRWHLAHTTWFFETFVLKQLAGYQPASEAFEYLFNSYYNTVGEQFPRDRRGLLSRPTVDEIFQYRRDIDDQMTELLGRPDSIPETMASVIEVGLQHEQQHQELMLTDIKHVLSCNPLLPTYAEVPLADESPPLQKWISFDPGVCQIGHDQNGFAFDNELPRHRVFLEPYELSNRLVTNGEFLDFIADGGYQRSELWLSMGWNEVAQHTWTAPLHWSLRDGVWTEFSLAGSNPLSPHLPVTHISYFEADAFARWADARLPTEAEWEQGSMDVTAEVISADERLSDGIAVHPSHQSGNAPLNDMFGSVWQWTSSSYGPYPGYKPLPGALGEYNGKFMCNQYVLRGSSCATSANHHRATYRNFFPPSARWQFSGLRLARSVAHHTDSTAPAK